MSRTITKGFKVYTIGNSRGIYLDKDTCEYLGINEGDWIEVTIKKPPEVEK